MIESLTKHSTDQEFYTSIKFFEYVIEKKELDSENNGSFSLDDVSIGEEETGSAYNRVASLGELLDITVAIESGYRFDEDIEKAKGEANKKPVKEKERLLKILNNIKKKKDVKITDVSAVSWVWYEVYEHIKFTPWKYKVPKEIETALRNETNTYLDNFINGKLAITKKNYYKFETQKKVLIRLIEEGNKIALYGNNFILSERIDNDCVSEKIPDFCIIHTVYALQRLGYLKVVDVWEEREYERKDSSRDLLRYVNANIILEDALITEINNKYKKDNPKNIFEKFDAKNGVLKFAGKEIELSKKGKETDAVLLLKTLLKEKGIEWKHNDEILADWGYNEDDQKETPKNKVYFAGLKVNNAVALKTQIEDFLEVNTSKARINPKYRKVDE